MRHFIILISSFDRRVAMNKLKIELRTMNKETRKKVMLDLQKSFSKNSTGRQISEHKQLSALYTGTTTKSTHAAAPYSNTYKKCTCPNTYENYSTS
jgi:hypothetical protein